MKLRSGLIILFVHLAESRVTIHKSHEALVLQSCETAINSSNSTFCHNQDTLVQLTHCLYDIASLNTTRLNSEILSECPGLTLDSLQAAHTRSSTQNSTLEETYHRAYTAYSAKAKTYTDSFYMGAVLLGYWAFIFTMASMTNIVSKLMPTRRGSRSSTTLNSIRQRITIPTLFTAGKHTVPFLPLGSRLTLFSGLLPTRLESLVLAGFTLLCLYFTFSFKMVSNSLIWPDWKTQYAHNIGMRTGVLCMFTIQLTFLFAGRNNFLLWTTGWKQASFIAYHKWISRVNLIFIIIHTAAFHVVFTGMRIWDVKKSSSAYQWGVFGVLTMVMLVVFGLYWLRRTHYELFLSSHILLALLFVLGTFRHLQEYGAEVFAYPIIAIWAFDRLVRVGRLVAFGVQRAHCSVLSNDTIKITIPKRKFWKAFPGAYGYLHFWTPTGFFQSHPFSLVINDNKDVVMYVKIKGGLTSAIHRRLSQLPDQSGDLLVSVEGPYGDKKPLKRFNTVLLYAGGNGIPSPYAYAKSLAHKDKVIKLYWIIRKWRSLDWFQEELAALKNTNVEVVIYVTKHEEETKELLLDSDDQKEFEMQRFSGSSDEFMASETEDERGSFDKDQLFVKSKSSCDFIEFRHYRPNISELITQDLEASRGNVAVMACGHATMVDEIRNSVANNLNTAEGRVDYYEELQTW